MALFHILSPDIDPVKNIERLSERFGFIESAGTFFNISLGEGQEDNALRNLSQGAAQGSWVVCQNLHRMGLWLGALEKHVEKPRMADLHPTFRVFYTAEPCEDIPAGLSAKFNQNHIRTCSWYESESYACTCTFQR
jgi:dynein heavy chain